MTGAANSETRQGSVILAVAAVLFAALVLPFVLEDDKSDDALAMPGGVPAGADSPYGTSTAAPRGGTADTGATRPNRTDIPETSGPTVPPWEDPDITTPASAAPTRVADPREEAFRQAARIGTCLNAYQTGATGTDVWNTEAPRVVDCSSNSAYVRVAGVNTSDCPDADPGITSWRYGDISLCLERKFSQGQCFLVAQDGGSKEQPLYSANLFTWVDCDAQRIPAAFDSLLVISDLYRATNPVPADACSRGANDRNPYWYWVAAAQSTLVCATYPAR